MSKPVTSLRNCFAQTLKRLRKVKNLSQEDFSLVSSRTYISVLERSQNSPTIEKLDELADVLGVHPAALLLTVYAKMDAAQDQEVIDQVAAEAKNLLTLISKP
jgi:transcriptional regulator with XRE-family HTH domain